MARRALSSPTGRGAGLALDRAGRSSPLPVWIPLGILYTVWGSTYLAIKFGIRTIPPFLMASTRFLVAGTVLFIWASRRGDRRQDRIGLPQWRAAAIVGTALLAGGNGGVVWAEG